MPRFPRHHIAGVPVHVIQRGNNRQPCFFTKIDYTLYLKKLYEYCSHYGVNIHSYVLMTNHVHLLLTPNHDSAISQAMQSLGRYYVRYINSCYKRTGTLWEGRYKDSLVDSERYLLTVSRYIELNPVRARMVSHAAEYPWSSYRTNALGRFSSILTPHPIYLALGRDENSRQKNYRALFSTELPLLTVKEIREAANKSWVLGDGKFKKEIEDQLGYSLPPFPRGGDRKSQSSRNTWNQVTLTLLIIGIVRGQPKLPVCPWKGRLRFTGGCYQLIR